MKLQFKHQGFQIEAAKAVVDVFNGQPRQGLLSYIQGEREGELPMEQYGFCNQELFLQDQALLQNIHAVQARHGLQPIRAVARDEHGTLPLSIEMETGTGKTYTYIKTMYELHKHYGWTKFVIVVPSVAIREGVIKSLDTMSDHFATEYGERMQYFVYDSSRLVDINQFVSDPKLQVMVINMQAFNATDDKARRISMQLESFGWQRPIEVLAAARPILIIDEPQSVLGADKQNKTREGLKQFNPLFYLLYSATHRPEDVYNQVYRLDAIDAYDKRLVKKIEVIGVHQVGTTGTTGYLYLDEIISPKNNGAPRARIVYEKKQKDGIGFSRCLIDKGDDIYKKSGGLEAYHNGYRIDDIDVAGGFILLSSGRKLSVGHTSGGVTNRIRRTQIRHTIRAHFERERQLYRQGIKVLSLFFIDAVDKYRIYDRSGVVKKGSWANIFEDEYQKELLNLRKDLDPIKDKAYLDYLDELDRKWKIENKAPHNGYFSQDARGKTKSQSGADTEDGSDAYQLIMRDKERLLSFEEPVRFIFSHSALKEGWDNPNVFQICTLKHSNSTTKKHQEVGRGMRLCVDQNGVRQDSDLLGDAVHDTNILTVIASESYQAFSGALQKEIINGTSRPTLVEEALPIAKTIDDGNGSRVFNEQDASGLIWELINAGYISKLKLLTAKYFKDKEAKPVPYPLTPSLIQVLDRVVDPTKVKIEDAQTKRTAKYCKARFNKFEALWDLIKEKTYYQVELDTPQLIKNAIEALDTELSVSTVQIVVTSKSGSTSSLVHSSASSSQQYDLIGELVRRTGLKRQTIADILKGIKPATFKQYSQSPEEFIIKAGDIIDGRKISAVTKGITYHTMTPKSQYSQAIFEDQELRGSIGIDALKSEKALYDLIVVDSLGTEMEFANELEKYEEVEVYTKLPRSFYINTPAGRYNPDWAIVFRKGKGTVNHVYFVAETKGSESMLQLREIERVKIECARKHFEKISGGKLKFDIVTSYTSLYNKAVKK